MARTRAVAAVSLPASVTAAGGPPSDAHTLAALRTQYATRMALVGFALLIATAALGFAPPPHDHSLELKLRVHHGLSHNAELALGIAFCFTLVTASSANMLSSFGRPPFRFQ